ncbi:MAG: hypothetical protein RMN24_01145 [Anaerolineae bacterium]|nr:hypothetical protein [Anaerolineae bacterium]
MPKRQRDRFTPEQLETIEAQLWELAVKANAVEMNFPPLSALLGTLGCEMHANDLVAYARDRARGDVAAWSEHPLLLHLQQCESCQRILTDLEMKYRRRLEPTLRPQHPAPAVDLTIFNHDLPQAETDVRSVLDSRRPLLLYSGFLTEPDGWYFTLESEAHANGSPPDVVLTLTPSEGTAAGLRVTLITFGQILHAVTDEQGQARFPHLRIPPAELEGTPILSLRVQTPLSAAP